MNRREREIKSRHQRRAERRQAMLNNGEKSRYAKKKAWLAQHTRNEVWPVERMVTDPATGVARAVTEMVEVRRQFWGFEIPSPKPWV